MSERINHNRAWNHFKSIGAIPEDAPPFMYVLHHKDPTLKANDPDRYAEWNIEDLVVMTNSDHVRLHNALNAALGVPNGFEGKTFSATSIKQLSKSLKGRPVWNKGIERDEATKAKIRSKLIGKHIKHRRRVRQSDLDGTIIAEFESAAEASRVTGIKNIKAAARKVQKHAGGFVWDYLD